ncbi:MULTISPECIES: polyketide cyclase [Ochrobactrum]|uniref:polyketide cyclase n=1 Tax=Ochrobactrum TaxID=528 RepID=UPI002989ADD1|nr:polyketide cyclase [Ochrobactrum sp. AN78]MDH7793356.1 uncharacterized protein YndB with AHSA1/START domain [Ochrobactrum sp. AN78]
MSDTEAERQEKDLLLEYELDAPPEKVWRAVNIPAFQDKRSPKQDLAETEPVSTAQGEEGSYRMWDDEPPFLESIVTFEVRPDAKGCTIFRIVHGMAVSRVQTSIVGESVAWAP